MQKIITFELKRYFTSKSFLVAMCLGIALIAGHALTSSIPRGLFADYAYWREGARGFFPLTLWNNWLGLDGSSGFAALYYYLLPLLVCLPLAGGFRPDLESGFVNLVTTRVSLRKYILAKSIAVFLSAATIAVAPLLLDYFVAALLLPMITPDSTAATFPVYPASIFGNLFYSSPHLYSMFYMLLSAIISGLVAGITLPLSLVMRSKFLITVTPFSLFSLLANKTGAVDYSGFVPSDLLAPYKSINVSIEISAIFYLSIFVLILISLWLFGAKGKSGKSMIV